ncbi:GGDEF domain-containing protein [Anaerosporobacter faecicola]|uniref:GGDEF domain-containing protein n=1 Tax=Anaerosporobacter faecicola TaxID=2718714 RepID=UPI00143BE406|nr:GGDEF domain-containing protein [Anaerosporobacter faecicola]
MNKETQARGSKFGIFYLLLVFGTILIAGIGIVYAFTQDNKYHQKSTTKKLLMEGTYTVNEGNTSYPLHNNTLKKLSGYNKVVITGHFTREIPAGDDVILRIDNMKIRISVNEEQVYEYGQEGTFPEFSHSAGNQWGFFRSKGITPEDTITMELSNVYNNHVNSTYGVFMSNLQSGDKIDVVLKNIRNNVWNVIVSILIIGVGFISLMTALINPTNKVARNQLLIFSGLAISCGFWCFIDFRVQNFYVPYPTFNNCLDIVLLLSMLGAVLFYIAYDMKCKCKMIMHLVGLSNFAFIVVMTYQQFFRSKDYYDHVFSIEILIIIDAIVAVICSLYEASKRPRKARYQILLAPILLGIGGSADVICSYFGIFKQTMFGKTCFIIYIIFQYFYSASAIKGIYSKNMRMEVYRELAFTDVMTGCRNRTAFNEYVTGLEKKLLRHEVAGIMVVDINHLKRTNDVLGHKYGDQLIIKVCKLLEEVFAHSCVYRIGGDEFSVVLEGTDLNKKENLLEELDLLIEEENLKRKEEEYISIAKGIAVWDDKMDHSFEELFVRADNAMYEDKFRSKRFANKKILQEELD